MEQSRGRSVAYELSAALLPLGAFVLYAQGMPFILRGTLVATLMMAVVLPSITNRPLYWVSAATPLMCDIAIHPLRVANHEYLLALSCLAIVVATSCCGGRAKQEYLRAAGRWMLIVLFFFATVQKVLSPAFMSGEYYWFMLARGSFFRPLLEGTDFWLNVVEPTRAQMELLSKHHPVTDMSVLLGDVPSHLVDAAKALAIVTLIVEIWLFVGYLVWRRRR